MNTQELELFGHIKKHVDSPSMMKYMSLTEDAKVNVGRNLVDQIYINISENYNAIDFGTIPASNGKLSSMKEYHNLKSSVDLLLKMDANAGTHTKEVGVLADALTNMVRLEDMFFQGFVKKNTQLIMTYNLLAMALYCGTSLMIGALVDYVNVGNTDTVDVIISRKYSKTNSYLMINTLSDFNTMVKNGKFKEFASSTTKPVSMNESVVITTGMTIMAILAIFKIIPLIKEIIYILFTSRMKLSEAAEIQAQLVDANVAALKSNGTATQKTIKIQSWFADKLHQISNVFAIKYEKNEKKALADANAKLDKNDVVLF